MNFLLLTNCFQFIFELGSLVRPYFLWSFLLDQFFLNNSMASLEIKAFIGCTSRYRNNNQRLVANT